MLDVDASFDSFPEYAREYHVKLMALHDRAREASFDQKILPKLRSDGESISYSLASLTQRINGKPGNPFLGKNFRSPLG